MKSEFAGSEWLKRSHKVTPSPLGEKVADILGHVFRGLYHLDGKTLSKADWSDSYVVEVVLKRSLSTWDFADLSELVILCHDEMVRMEISPHTFNSMRLMFHQRVRTGDISERHPTIEAQIGRVRNATTSPDPEVYPMINQNSTPVGGGKP